MAIVCDCLKYIEVLNEVLQLSGLQSSDKRFKQNKELALVILHRYLFVKSLNGCFTKFKKVIESRKSAIHSAVVRVKLRRKITDLSQAAATSVGDEPVLPRYIRVNSLVSTVPKVLSALTSGGFVEVDSADVSLGSSPKWVSRDTDIQDLMVLPPNTDLHDNQLVLNGSIILQDKASCLPAFVLNPPIGSNIIDACAAPGNKTSHLAAITNNTGSITAFELNRNRSKTLIMMLNKAKVTCCQVVNADFTQCDVSKYSNVEYILVDPSCSGSGISSRMNSLTDNEDSNSKKRLDKLSSFQSVILKKALSFPKVKKVVYSTCSTHSLENEWVVKDVLQQFEDKFSLERILPAWPHRGETLEGEFPIGADCIRASPETTQTIGFFLAAFVRK